MGIDWQKCVNLVEIKKLAGYTMEEARCRNDNKP
jgi:hypothetical protein